MYYLCWFVILFRIQILEEGTECVIFQTVHVAFICFPFAWWLFWCSSAVYPVVVIGTKSLKLVFHLHCDSCLLLWAPWGRSEQDLVFGEMLLMLIEEHLCLWHLVTALRAYTGSLSCTRFSVSAWHMRAFLCSSQIQKWWVSDECQKLTFLMRKTLPRPFQGFIHPLPWGTTTKRSLLVDTGQGDHADALLLLVPSPHGSHAFLPRALLAEQRVGAWAASHSTWLPAFRALHLQVD